MHSARQVLTWHTTRYPRLEVQDLYKLVYQGIFGSEHAVIDASQARVWLEREVKALAEGPEEPLLAPVSPDGRIVRVNLRPYMAGGGNLEALLEEFLRTAREHKGTEEQLKQYWWYVEQMAEEQVLGIAATTLQRFFEEMEARGFPAVHHSDAYRRAYQPAYRVVVREYISSESEKNNSPIRTDV